MVPQRNTGRGCKQWAIVHCQHDKRRLDFLEYSAPLMSVTLEPRDLVHKRKGGHLCCVKHRPKGRVNPCHPVPWSWGPSEARQGEGEGCTQSTRFAGEGLVDVDSSTCESILPWREEGPQHGWWGTEKHSASCLSECPGSLPSSLLLQALKALSKVWLTLEKKIKGIKSQGLETYLKSHLYHVALGVFWNPQSAHWFQRKGPGTDTKFSLPSGATTWKQEPGAFLPRIWKERKCYEAPGKRRSIGEERALVGRLRPMWLVVGSAVQQWDASTVMRTAVNSPRNFLMTEPAGSLGSGETDRPWSCLSSNFQEQGPLNRVDTNILATKVMLSASGERLSAVSTSALIFPEPMFTCLLPISLDLPGPLILSRGS